MPLVTYNSVCTSKNLIARGVYEIRFTKPVGFSFLPGQFILFDVPLIEKPEDIQTRALSIASTNEEEELLFIAKIVVGGRISRWIEEIVSPGTMATFKGPFGKFLLQLQPPTEVGGYLFIATGAGIAPFRPMILRMNSEANRRQIDLVFGVRSEEDLFWKDWLEEISRRENVQSHIALSQPSPSWTGHRGRVQAVTPEVVKGEFAGKTLYVCGNPDMTNDVKRLALEEWGIDKKDLHVEGYI